MVKVKLGHEKGERLGTREQTEMHLPYVFQILLDHVTFSYDEHAVL